MPGNFTRIEGADPHLIPEALWEKLPPSEKVLLTRLGFRFQEWAPLDRRGFRIEPESYRFQVSVANVGSLRASRIISNRATQTTLHSPAEVDGFGISIIKQGANRLILPGTDEPVIGKATTGLIHSVGPGTSFTGSDLQDRLFLR
jgi:hypothetical protein